MLIGVPLARVPFTDHVRSYVPLPPVAVPIAVELPELIMRFVLNVRLVMISTKPPLGLSIAV